MDLLDQPEERDRDKVFDIRLLADRLTGAVDWLSDQEVEIASLPVGTVWCQHRRCAAALVAAAESPESFRAVVSRGGRPDLASEYLPQVKTPTLLIVGGHDDVVIELNKKALHLLRCPKELVIVPGATHLFEEPGTLQEVARLAKDWFMRHFTPASEQSRRSAES